MCDFLLPKKQERKRSQCFQEREGAHVHPAQRWLRREHWSTFCSVSSQVPFLTSFCCEEAEPDGCPGTTWIRSRKLRSIRVSKAIFATWHKWHRRSQLCPVASVGAGGGGAPLERPFPEHLIQRNLPLLYPAHCGVFTPMLKTPFWFSPVLAVKAGGPVVSPPRIWLC